MKLIHQIAGCGAVHPQRWSARPQHFAQRPACNAVHSTAGRCGQVATAGVVMLAIVWSGWAVEPDPTTLKELRGASDSLPTVAPGAKAGRQTTDGGGQPALRRVQRSVGEDGSLGEAGRSEVRDQLIPAAAAGGTNPSSVVRPPSSVVSPPSPFSAEIGADFIKKVMETSAKIEEAKRQIAERQAQLYATNPEIKSTRARMIEGQKEINRILDADQELAELKMSRDILWSTMPVLPKGQNPASMPRMPVAR